MFNPEIFGYIGAILNIVMLLPQAYLTVKTKDTNGLSLATILVFLAACFFWTIYGVAKVTWPVIITNAVVGVINIVLLLLKLRYK